MGNLATIYIHILRFARCDLLISWFSELLVDTYREIMLTACSHEDTPRLNAAAIPLKYPTSDSHDSTRADVLCPDVQLPRSRPGSRLMSDSTRRVL